jgi:ubiquitin-protein ligase
MSDTELQEEEREVLSSIYDGDDCFKQISPNTFQYKYGESDTVKSFLLEIQWGETYPSEPPVVNMDTFYNKHVVKPLKDKIVSLVLEEADQYLGMSMTYTLFEFLKERFDTLIAEQPENPETSEKSVTVEQDQNQVSASSYQTHATSFVLGEGPESEGPQKGATDQSTEAPPVESSRQ